jgi:gliding motility-associated-like protein
VTSLRQQGIFITAITLLSFLAIGVQAQADLCSGSLGENTFTDGDFGTGAANVFPTDPGLAPGYQYSTQVPINDGVYTLTNNSGAWAANWPTWLLIGDNSSDPEGYMMIVNASFTPGIFFEKTVTDLCDNTVYEFSADVINFVMNGVPDHILPNVSFFVDDELFYSTGPIQQDEKWRKVGFTFTTDPGRTEVKLTMRNNAPGGVGNDIALDNIAFQACGSPSKVTTNTPGIICEDAEFPTLSAEIEDDTLAVVQWQISEDGGLTWSDLPGGTTLTFQVEPVPPGEYIYRFLHATSATNLQNEKCRTVSDFLTLEVVPIEFLIVDTICEGLSYLLGNENVSETGIYIRTFISSMGCDSIVTLDLTIIADPRFTPKYTVRAPGCYRGDDGSIVLEEVPGGVEPFLFQISGDIDYVEDTLILPSGEYLIYLEDRYRCYYEGVITVPETPEFVLTGLVDTSIILGYAVSFAVQSNYPVQTVVWSPPDGLSCLDCLEIVARPFNTTNYEITAVSENGCTAIATVRIDVERAARVYAPNVFSPNNDGVNDVWGLGVDDSNVRALSEVVIFDRWGGVIFSGQNILIEDIGAIWDGRKDGQLVASGVYTFLLRLILVDNTVESKAGTITVLR